MRSVALAALFAITSATCADSIKAYCEALTDKENSDFDCDDEGIK